MGGLDVDYSNGGAVDIGDLGSVAPGGAAMTTYINAAPPPGALAPPYIVTAGPVTTIKGPVSVVDANGQEWVQRGNA